MVPDAVAETIRRTYEESGEFAAAIELRRHFPGITDNNEARRCARAIAGWTAAAPLPAENARTCSPKTRS